MYLKNHIRLLCAAASFFTSSPCLADVEAQDRYVWSGEINRQGMDVLRAELSKNNHVRAIEFRDSLGASHSGGILISEINELIRAEKLETYARGLCASACAVSFLLGNKRTMILDGKRPTVLMLHPVRSIITDERNSGLTEKLNKLIIEKSGGKFTAALLDKMFDAVTPLGGIYIGATPIKFQEKSAYVVFCRGDELPGFNKCQPFYDVAPEDLGIDIQDNRK